MTEDFLIPDYSGGALVNLVAELERRLTGSALHPGLHPALAAAIPPADSYVLVLFDGLGDHQLTHRAAAPLAAARVGVMDAGWPTTTTVSMATVATGMTPAEHGLLGYQMRVPETGFVVNTIKWTTQWGEPIHHELWGFLPLPNLWERLASHGIEPVTLQPWNFDDSPMSRMLYRGCRFEPWGDEDEAATIAAELAAVSGRLVFFYIPHIDFAAHVGGQDSDDYGEAMGIAARMWERLVRRLPAHAVAVGTADHGHVDVPEERRIEIPKSDHDDRDFGGDPRAPFVYGEVASLASKLGVDWLPRAEVEHWWGPGAHHPGFEGRAPDGVLLPPPGWVVFHRHADDRLIGQHGGHTAPEMRIPLLVGTSPKR
jgi:hypothetical protein